jgi:nucleoside triphosphate pyrophosphatase
MTWILASASTRRSDLLAQAGQRFVVEPSCVEEVVRPGESATTFAARVAREKALEIARGRPGRWVLGADTVVIVDDAPLGKPACADEAIRMLQRLSGRTHQVATAFALVDSRGHVFEEEVVISEVAFRNLQLREIEEYVESGEPYDKAGAYAIQGGAGRFVAELRGSRSNVVGLPMDEVESALRSAGLWRCPQARLGE